MISPDPGSFRDPASRVIHDELGVLRLLDPRGLAAWKTLSQTDFFREAVKRGDIIRAEEVVTTIEGAAGALRHPRLPLITYPYEWTFSMLRDAALLQLDLLRRALGAGLTIKDATPYNIQFLEGRPVFIDVGSFEPYQPGEPWIGYRQFTRLFLFPLMMRARVGIPFQPWLRGDLEGPTASQMREILGPWRRLRPTALLHVGLQARLEKRMAGTAVRDDLKTAGFGAELILANVARLERAIRSLVWEPSGDGWAGYHSCTHVGRDRETKTTFLEGVLGRVRPSTVVDLGANDGHFSKVVASSGAHVVAVDGDEAVLEDLYRQIGGTGISVVLTDLANPSPSQGWAGAERPGLFDRVRPELVIAYGLIHHLIYTSSVPPAAVLAWLHSLDAVVALEFVSPDDEMVKTLIANKHPDELHPGLNEDDFRAEASKLFDITQTQTLESGTRVLFELRPR